MRIKRWSVKHWNIARLGKWYRVSLVVHKSEHSRSLFFKFCKLCKSLHWTHGVMKTMGVNQVLWNHSGHQSCKSGAWKPQEVFKFLDHAEFDSILCGLERVVGWEFDFWYCLWLLFSWYLLMLNRTYVRTLQYWVSVPLSWDVSRPLQRFLCL